MDMDLSRCFTLDFVPFSKLLVNEYGIYFILVLLLYPANYTFTNSQKQCSFNVIRAVCISNHILEVFWTLYGSVVLRLLREGHFPVCNSQSDFQASKKKCPVVEMILILSWYFTKNDKLLSWKTKKGATNQ